ncbi:hypothetical protein D3C72_2331330 [compost metagenome]
MAFLTHMPLAAAATSNSHAECALMSEGIYNGSWMKHRIVLEEEVLYGANDMGNILVQLDSLRGQGLCQ